MNFGQKLQEARKREGLTQIELAEKVGIDHSAIARFEKGIRIPSLMTAKCLADVLNMSLDDLLS